MNRLLVLMCTLALGACSTQYRADAGPVADGSAPMRALTLESEPSLALAFGESAQIAVLYTEADAPVVRAPIRFALEGRAHDSTVADLSADTDVDGRAQTSMVAGSTSSAFRVRVSAEWAAPVYVNVSVGNMGFGTLVVQAEYAGDRAGTTRRRIEIYSSMSCADERPPFADRMATLDDPTMLEARFRALPAGLTYAVFGRVEGPGGVVLASACTDGVVVVRDSETTASLSFEDLPLAPAGDYDAVLALTATGSSTGVTEAASAAGAAHIASAGSGADLYLDALEEELRYRGEALVAEALATERLTGAPESSLATELAASGGDPEAALAATMSALRARMTALALSGPLSLAVDTGSLVGTWEVSELAVGPSEPDAPVLVFDPAMAGLVLTPTLSLSWPSDDALVLESVSLTLPLGTLARVTIAAEVGTRGLASAGEWLATAAGCEALATWIADDPIVGTACTVDCPRAVCVRALDGVMAAVDATLVASDAERDTIALSGTITMHDDNGDLVVDQLTATELSGSWSGPVDADSLAGGLTAARSPR